MVDDYDSVNLNSSNQSVSGPEKEDGVVNMKEFRDSIQLFLIIFGYLFLAAIGITHIIITTVFFHDRCKNSMAIYAYIAGGLYTCNVIMFSMLSFIKINKKYVKLIIFSCLNFLFVVSVILLILELSKNTYCLHNEYSPVWISNLTFSIIYGFIVLAAVIIGILKHQSN